MKPLKIGSPLYATVSYQWSSPRSRHYIVGETAGLWLVSPVKRGGIGAYRVNKKTLMQRDGVQKGMPRQWFTEAQHRDKEYVDMHRNGIERSLIGCSAEQLRAVAAITGYGMAK